MDSALAFVILPFFAQDSANPKLSFKPNAHNISDLILNITEITLKPEMKATHVV